MNTGNSVRDAGPRYAVNTDLPTVEDLQESVEALQEPADMAVAGDEEQAAPARPSFHHVQDIQELVDKLDAVTKQLRHPGHS
ncbi:MAG TPA: hypothetical protein VGG16_28470 [Streptosporangiaceae bacterium]|jgi:hypothetical protein